MVECTKKILKILIAGVGNELRQDDAFGIEFVRRWDKEVSPCDHIVTMEVGIAGIHLVQELHTGYDVLIIVDAVDYSREAGSISIERVEKLGDIEAMPLVEKREFLADMHYTNPTRAMMLAQSLKILPSEVYLLGCQSKKHDDFDIGMSREVEDAIPIAIEKLKGWISRSFEG